MNLYTIKKIGAQWAVVLASKPECIQFRGTKIFCQEWMESNESTNAEAYA